MYLNRIHQIRDPVCYQHQVNCMILVCASVGISIYFSPATSCCLLRTGCSTRRPILCPSCTWATSPCLAARPSGRADSPGGRSPPSLAPFLNTSLLVKDSSCQCKGEESTVPTNHCLLLDWIMGLQWTEGTVTDPTLFIYVSLIYSLKDWLPDWSCVSLSCGHWSDTSVHTVHTLADYKTFWNGCAFLTGEGF